MKRYLDEAAELAAATPRNRCPTTDAIDYLDAHPQLRLALEDTWIDPAGRVYRTVPAEHISRWPGHLAKHFRTFLRIGRSPEHVFQLLDLLHATDAGPEVVRMTIAGCRRRRSLAPAIEYYTTLKAELDAVSVESHAQEVNLGTRELRCRPAPLDGEAAPGLWYIATAATGDPLDRSISPSYRTELLHDPDARHRHEPDWFSIQSAGWRRAYQGIRAADERGLETWKCRLIDTPKHKWSKPQLEILWDAYRIQRDRLRALARRRAEPHLRPTARALIREIERTQFRGELGRLGALLYDASQGKLALPGPVSQAEWSVVFASYRSRRSVLSRLPR